MTGPDDIKFMTRCLELAFRAEGYTYPNPMVGSVIVHEGIIIGEGFHLKAGEPHAEVNAINSVIDKAKLKESTLYVNLEPCSHYGRTPPCSELIISNSIPRVVIGTTDTSSKVSGRGIAKLLEAGTEVVSGVMENECRYLNRRFFTFNEKMRPYITLKWAQSNDGFIDINRTGNTLSEPNWITGKAERILVHKWRASEESILVGAGTVNADNPRLDVREWPGHNPAKFVLSGRGTLNREAVLFKSGSNTVVFSYNVDDILVSAEKVKLEYDVPSSVQIVAYLYKMGIQSLFIEGGTQVLMHFIETELWDEARVFTGPELFCSGIKAPELKVVPLIRESFSGSHLTVYQRGTDMSQ